MEAVSKENNAMVKLLIYNQEYKNQSVIRIADFFGFHASLINGKRELQSENYIEAEKTLQSWMTENHELYMIDYDGTIVGFLHIGYRGENVAWIEDIYVDEKYRNIGIATKSIHLAEEIIKSKPAYTAICFDVSPRNEVALKLYHKLGYNNLSLITVRKELYENKRDQKQVVSGLPFNY